MTKRNGVTEIMSSLCGIVGLALVWNATNWMAALGLFLALFANNLGQSRDKLERT